MERISSLVVWGALFGGGVSLIAGTAGSVQKTILVTVLDKEGAAIRDLTPAEFSVSEDGRKREVIAASLSSEPGYVSMLIDTSRVQEGDVDRIRDLRTSLTTFVKTLHGASPTTEIALMTVGGAAVPVSAFTTQSAELERITSRLVPDLAGGAVVLEALIDAAYGIKDKPSPRRAIVAIDFASRENSSVQPTKVVEEVFKSGASVWAVSVHGSMGGTAPRRDTAMNHLTAKTGGVRATALLPSALEGILQNLARSLVSQYEVTYVRPDDAAPKSIVPSAKRGAKFLMAPFIQ